MSDTPITDALASDHRTEKRDVPQRVWLAMERLERDRAELIEVVRESYDQIDCDTGDADLDVEHKLLKGRISALLARIEKE